MSSNPYESPETSVESRSEAEAAPQKAVPSEAEIVRAVQAFAANRLSEGAYPDEVEEMLVEKGVDRDAAAGVVDYLCRSHSEAMRYVAKRDIKHGAMWCVGGTIVTAATYAAAYGGGTYIIAWGAIGFGALQFLRGLLRLRN